MRILLALSIGLLFSLTLLSQSSEFKIYPNGLIYSEQAMGRLSHIVDSLNLKFMSCDLNKPFYSKSQTVGHLVIINSGNIAGAKKDMENHMAFDAFLQKYPHAKVEKQILVIKSKYKSHDNKDVVEFKQVDLKSDYGFSINRTGNLKFYNEELKNKWLFEYYEKTSYSEETIKAFYFPDNFNSKTLPQKYAKMIGYSDCLIDTTTTKFKKRTEEGWVDLPENWTLLSEKEKANLLDKMRGTKVVGFCSRDNRPRQHAVNIALLSAETANWGVFLKAHLDIMNDRFDRMSDGSYAWGQRNTYIKELEELNINVPDLIFGISFRVENAANNHYNGSISRVGRALSETNKRNEIEQSMLLIIEDPELDDYNRILFYYLFLNYNHFIKDEKVKSENKLKLANSVSKLPEYIKSRLTNE